jgi:hypothetical protein
VAVKGLRAQTGLNKLVYGEVLYLHRVKAMSDLSNLRNLFKVAKEDPSGRATFARSFFNIKPGSRCTVAMKGVKGATLTPKGWEEFLFWLRHAEVLFIFKEQLDCDLGPLWRIGSDSQRLYVPSDQLLLALEGGEAWAEAYEILL